MQDTVYTLENQLDKVLAVLPRERGDLFYVRESVWQDANPDYEKVRNPDRKGHFGLISTSLSGKYPQPLRTHHGHSNCYGHERWYHLEVVGVSAAEPDHEAFFDLLHCFSIPWRRFFKCSEGIAENRGRSSLTEAEMVQLDSKEHKILTRMQQNYEKVVEAYRRNPAWKNRFPGAFGEQTV